MAGPI